MTQNLFKEKDTTNVFEIIKPENNNKDNIPDVGVVAKHKGKGGEKLTT